MLRHKFPALLSLFALSACASDADLVLVSEHPSQNDVANGELPFAENPLAGGVISPDGEVLVEAAPASETTYREGELDQPEVEDAEAEFQRLAGSSLADAERLDLEHLFDQAGIQPGDVKLVGRLVLEEDVYTVADDVLALSDQLGVVEKGRVLGETFPTTVGTPGGLESAASTIYARVSGGNFQFFRPYVTGNILYVVPTNNFLLTLMTTIVRSVNDTATDCLTNGASGTLRAGTEANYAALSTTAKQQATKVTITHGPLATVCPGAPASVAGCALAPRKINILHLDGVTRSTMTAGGRIGLVNTSTAVSGTDGRSRRIATHELLHTLGIAHPFQSLGDPNGDGQPDGIQVPGTSTSTTVLSVMQNGCIPATTNCNVANPPTCCNIAATNLSTEDTDMIDTLYSPQAGGSCAYVDNFQNVVAN